jgi:hypothetical protein
MLESGSMARCMGQVPTTLQTEMFIKVSSMPPMYAWPTPLSAAVVTRAC